MNAYTFGMVEPQVVVVYAGVFSIMDADELRFIIGHELGHIRLGHTWLNSLVGGMAGIPSPYVAAILLYIAFRWWNRACEYSADRAGLLACGKPEKAASALIKLVGGSAVVRSSAGPAAGAAPNRSGRRPSGEQSKGNAFHPPDDRPAAGGAAPVRCLTGISTPAGTGEPRQSNLTPP